MTPNISPPITAVQAADGNTDVDALERRVFVDLDGTLIVGDLLWDSVIGFCKQHWLHPFYIVAWLLQGRAHLKRQVAQRYQIAAERLSYRPEVLEYLRRQRAAGYKIVLATASDRTYADSIAAHLGLFDDVIASDGINNLKGAKKLAAIVANCRQSGASFFCYLGDHRTDLTIWSGVVSAVGVAPSRYVRRSLMKLHPTAEILVERPTFLRSAIKAMRPHQWCKNLLIIAPLVFAHAVTDEAKLAASLLAMGVFSMMASAIYLLNDLVDMEVDRLHATKRNRPLASGALTPAQGLGLMFGLLVSSVGLSFLLLPFPFLGALAVYVVANVGYSLWLKRKPIVDIILLTSLYTLRIFAGGLAASIVVSEWLLALSTFLFLSLAVLKRYTELRHLELAGIEKIPERGYEVVDLELLRVLGPASGLISILVLMLYINSVQARGHYRHPELLWLVCPLVLYWICRVWFWGQRGVVQEDPIAFALKDRITWLVGLLSLALIYMAT